MTQPTNALRLVPVEPTEAMLDAARGLIMSLSFGVPNYETSLSDVSRSGYYGELWRDILTDEERSMKGPITKAHRAQLIYRAMLAAAPASPLPGGGWQDISTAPRDGTPLLAGSIHHSDREVVCWQDGLPSGSVAGAMNPDEPEEGWVNEGPRKDRFYANPRYFTHWMPLPAAPTGEPK